MGKGRAQAWTGRSGLEPRRGNGNPGGGRPPAGVATGLDGCCRSPSGRRRHGHQADQNAPQGPPGCERLEPGSERTGRGDLGTDRSGLCGTPLECGEGLQVKADISKIIDGRGSLAAIIGAEQEAVLHAGRQGRLHIGRMVAYKQ